MLGILAILFPPGVGPTPVEGIEVTRPVWMFWWVFELENRFGLDAILWGSGALFALLFAVPFIDRNPRRWWRRRPVAMAIAGLVLATIVVLSILTLTTSAASHLGCADDPRPPHPRNARRDRRHRDGHPHKSPGLVGQPRHRAHGGRQRPGHRGLRQLAARILAATERVEPDAEPVMTVANDIGTVVEAVPPGRAAVARHRLGRVELG